MKDIRSLTNLEVLALHENQISTIDREICVQFKNLKVLTLGNNKITNKNDVSFNKKSKIDDLV